MTSIRVPAALLADLHAAAPPGVSLPALVGRLLQEAGGVAAVRERLDAERRRAGAKAQVARLRNKGHRSVVLDEGAQVALAEAAEARVRRLEAEGIIRRVAGRRAIVLRSGSPVRDPSAPRPTMTRRGL